ncbi:MAG: NADH-quinone oxidoreductase subunit J [Pseudomonadales bacterium]|nr:NADH-quinone oxidoreductase subunit J [Pseudomonadales bacterium]
MELTFYTCALVAVLSTILVVGNRNPMHALLYLIVSLLAVSGVFFALGAPFAGALEVIVYAGAILVLFVFVVMMLNLGAATTERERHWLKPSVWIGPMLLAALVLAALLDAMLGADGAIGAGTVSPQQVGIALFGPYLLAVELASLLLLGALVVAYHLGREDPR